MMIRTLVAAVAVLPALTLPASAAPAEVAQVISLHWSGVSSAPSTFTTSGKVVLAQTLQLTIDDSDDLRGRATTRFTLDGTTYDGTFSVSGHYDGTDGLVFTTTLITADRLPGDLHWCGGTTKATLYRDQDRAGHFILKGGTDDTCGGHSTVEYTDP